ncbi:MAG: hypothetical protein WEB52_01050 [Dehalococcoidia bacterium]
MALPLVAVVVLLLTVPLFAAAPANLTSDESLYLAEAYNIAHGEGVTYPSGDAVVHRAPLFPAVLAPFVRMAGADGAYAVARAIVVVNALLVMLLAFRMGGALAGAIAGVTTAAASYLNGLGTTLYLDPFECTFMLLALLALHEATRSHTARWFAAAGACIGAALLVKEAGVQWAPLGAVAWLAVPSLRTRDGALGAALFTGAFAAAVAPWWAWVWVHDSSIYLLGGAAPHFALVAGSLIIAAFVAATAWLARAPALRAMRIDRAAMPAAGLLVAAWGGLVLYGLEASAGWKADVAYFRTVPDYLLTVAPQAQPYFALALAWPWLAWRAARGDESARLIFAFATLFLAFTMHAANRALQLRDALPLVYLSYLALGLAAAWGVKALARTLAHRTAEPLLMTSLAVLGTIFVVQQGSTFRDENVAAAAMGVDAGSWDNEFVRENAAWMSAHLPAGSHVLTSRLYFTSLHVQTDARFRLYQVPTVRVDVDASAREMLTPRSNLFRWGEHDVRPYARDDRWLYLRQYPGKAYWIALSQGELMDYVAAREIDYVTVSGDDVTFSPLAYASYFSAHPAFELIYHDARSAADQFFVYRVDRARLGIIDYPMTTSASSYDALQRESGLTPPSLAGKLGVPVRLSDLEAGLSPREEQAAVTAGTR